MTNNGVIASRTLSVYVAVGGLTLGLCLSFFCHADLDGNSIELNDAQATLRIELKPVIDPHMEELTQLVVEDKNIASALKEANLPKNQQTLQEITKRDKLWQEYDKLNPFEHQIMSNSCSKALRAFQHKSDIFSEIIVTNLQGVNVCLTNKTSDYYQADEQWWTEVFAQGEGRPYIGKLGFDASAHIDAIPIYVPVRDIESGKVIGIVKAVLNVLHLYRE